VGAYNVAHLWDTESHQPLGGQLHSRLEPLVPHPSPLGYRPVHQVSFSRDGRYLASTRGRNKISLWMVKDIAPQLPGVRAFMTILQCDELHGRTIHTSSLHCFASMSVFSRLTVCPPSQGYNRLMPQILLHNRRVTMIYTTTFFG
jgi:WD40 repeat protein